LLTINRLEKSDDLNNPSPHMELSLPGANGLGSEKSIIRFVNLHNGI